MFDNATMPVVGDPETMNDTYVEQISAAARAAIEVLDKKGVIDPKRVGVGGHSYGAFMTANLLAHTDLFAAGIARSGAYNRSLTPFGFQIGAAELLGGGRPLHQDVPVHLCEQDQRADPLDPRRGRQQFRHVPDPVGAVVPGDQGERWNGRGWSCCRTRAMVIVPANRSCTSLAEMFDWADRYVKNRADSNGSAAAGQRQLVVGQPPTDSWGQQNQHADGLTPLSAP